MMKLTSSEQTAVATLSCFGRWEYDGKYWKQATFDFLAGLANGGYHAECPTFTFSTGSPLGVTVNWPLKEGGCWATGTLSEQFPDFGEDMIIRSNCDRWELQAKLFAFIHSPKKVLVVNFTAQHSWQRRQGWPTAFSEIWLWKRSRTTLEIGGQEVSLTF
ncbi:MAG: hypothetical protein NUV80_03890 [Candidatus Berkelbacteria bacterium]|nr:hypothetical protein [Candidatus Berkelbacteria bacterium]MCR4307679.1 hypothetical protein [Candidatus Berkelbacteria bacterium]